MRDNRGRRHDLAVILVGVTLAVLSNRDGSLSSIHRHLVNHYELLVSVLGVKKQRPVSRAQLPRILENISVEVFDNLIFSHFAVKLNEKEQKWFAIDGKELRGSIQRCSKRGAAMVQAVAHENCQTAAQDYYCGKKESEVLTVRRLLETDWLAGQKISLDALHCKPRTLAKIVGRSGKYLVGLKGNQKQLLKQVSRASENQAVLQEFSALEKGHGRIEARSYEFYDLLEVEKCERWKKSEIRTAIKVKRTRNELKTGRKSQETSYYLTNEVGKYEELSAAIRGHWRVETNNYLRDVTFSEDRMRSKKRVSIKRWQK